MIIFINSNLDELFNSIPVSFSNLEKVWLKLVIFFCILTIISTLIFIFLSITVGFILLLFSLLGGFLMNIIMMFLCLIEK